MLDFFRRPQPNLKNETLSGLTVALAMVPEVVAFTFVAGVSPLIGLYSAFFLCLITAVLGGRPGMVSGAAGAMAVVIVTLVADHGLTYLFPAVIFCGLLQVGAGVAKLGKFIRMVPHPVMLGFVNGLAIVICLAQLGSFKTVDDLGAQVFLRGPALWIMLGLVGLTMLIIWQLPKFTRAVPASLAAIAVVTGLSLGINHFAPPAWSGQNQKQVVVTVGDMLATKSRAKEAAQAQAAPAAATAQTAQVAQAAPAESAPPVQDAAKTPEGASLSGGFPKLFFLEYALPPLTLETLRIIWPYALVLAGVGLVESLMTLTLVDEITRTRGQSNRECLGQGVGNIVCGFFGGMGGCAMIGQSLINMNSGGRGRWSGIVAALAILAFVLFLAPWIEMLPMSALVGVMFMVVIGTFEWASLKMMRKVPASDFLVMLLVAGYTVVMHDLASAVILGVIVSALVFCWRHATHLGAETKVDDQGVKSYQLHGPLFFGSVSSFKELFDPQNDPQEVVIDFYYTRAYDQSALEAINAVAQRYTAAGKKLHLRHLSPECRQLLDRAGDLVEVDVSRDPHYHVASDRLE